MDVTPPVIPGLAVDPTGKYRCPLCKVQRAGSDPDTGWVACPLVKHRMICLGSCLDIQIAARKPEVDVYNEFGAVARATRENVATLRWTCLRHQVQLIDDQLREGTDDEAELIVLRKTVVRAMARDNRNDGEDG